MALIGWDIGGTKCAAVLGRGEQGSVRAEGRLAFPTCATWQATLEQLAAASEELLGGERAEAVGVSCGGPLDSAAGVILSPPNLPGWDNVPVVQYAGEALHAPAFLENDANACALAEWRCGAGRGAESLVFLTFGTGLGAGIILGGRLWRGANGNAGELGHIRLSPFGPAGYGKPGSFEGYCSGGGLAQLGRTIGSAYMQQGKGRPGYPLPGASARELAQAAREGDACAQEVWRVCGEKLGEGLAVLVDLLNPERIVIGSIYARCEDLLLAPMRRALEREALPSSLAAVQVVPASLGEQVGDIAALCAAEYGLGGMFHKEEAK
ncbi:MAG: ROK family protein [Eubacteriales bacterium]|nr:ROK family protein [Eubacteriales bacterium]